jgi:tetratricopeptide (TPR) repeat protein/cellulose biosynthesis protein BcsQ
MTPNTTDTRGKVITFYSYKGGTGRSMALANVACLLAQRSTHSRGVLMMDWDLEAPGLHRFFRDRFTQRFGDGETSEARMNTAPGLIDLFFDLATATASTAPNAQSEDDAYALMETFDIDKYIIQTDVPSLSLLKAGAFTEHYSQRVTTFNWEALYTRSPFLMQALAERLTCDYSYVLVDSRTGISDVAGVCTMLLPEKLVVVFTPNRQSLLGLQDLIRRATKYRRQSDDLRPLIVLPLPSRIDLSEKDLQQWWRSSDKIEAVAYQPLFEQLFKDVYDLRTCDLSTYFDEVRIQHFPFYSYGEKIAVLQAGESDRLSLARSYETFTTWLADREFPWKEEQNKPAEMSAKPDSAAEGVKAAEHVLARLNPDEQRTMQRVLLRLVRVPEPGEQRKLNTSLQVKLTDFDPSAQQIVRSLHESRLLVVEQDDQGKEHVRFADDSLVNTWPRLLGWIKEDSELLLQRQRLRANIAQWEKSNKDKKTLLTGPLLDDARTLIVNRRANLNADEEKFIRESEIAAAQAKAQHRTTMVSIAILFVAALGVVLYQIWLSNKQDEFKTLVAEGYRLKDTSPDSAVALFTKAIGVQADNGEAYFGRGFVRVAKGERATTVDADSARREFVAAVADYDSVIIRMPSNAIAYSNRGDALLEIGDTARARADFDKALQLDSSLAMGNNNRAYLYYVEGNNAEALRLYARAIELDSGITMSYAGRGSTYLRLGDTLAAISDFNRSIQLKPDAGTYFTRGRLHSAVGAHEAAISDFTKSLELFPNNAEANFYRALSYFSLKNRQAAVADMRRAVAIAEDSLLLHNAKERLRAWGAADESREVRATRIAIYYNDVRDANTVRRLAQAISDGAETIADGSVRVDKPQVRSERTFGEVRYSHEFDRKVAERVRNVVQRVLAIDEDIKLDLQVIFLGNAYTQNVQRFPTTKTALPGTIEVWLPSLQTYLRSRQMGK